MTIPVIFIAYLKKGTKQPRNHIVKTVKLGRKFYSIYVLFFIRKYYIIDITVLRKEYTYAVLFSG